MEAYTLRFYHVTIRKNTSVMMLDALIQYDNFPDSNTNFTQHIHQFIYLKSYTENTHAKFYFISRIPS